MHTEGSEFAGGTFYLNDNAGDPARGIVVPGAVIEVEGWWDMLTGKSWMFSDGNFAAMHYAIRSGYKNLPIDDEVVYGHIGAFGHIVHVSEIGQPL